MPPAPPVAPDEVLQFLSAFREAATAPPPAGEAAPAAATRHAPTVRPVPTEMPPATADTRALPAHVPLPEETDRTRILPAPRAAEPYPAYGARPEHGVRAFPPPRPPVQPVPVSAPHVPAQAVTDRAGRRRMWERIVTASLLVVTAGSLAFLAVHNAGAAGKWRRLDQAQVQISTSAGRQVQAANASIAQLDAQVKSLQGQVASTQGQLSSVANQKEKAIDQTTVFKDLLAAAGEVANHLQGCISATAQLGSDLDAAVAAGDVAALGPLQSEASAVAATCAQAQQGNQELQAAIQSAS